MAKPLYKQVYESILHQIREGNLQPGERLPSEHALSEQFGVGRSTIRRALSELVADGFVETVQGVGTFVEERRFPKTAQILYGFSQEIEQRGKNVTSQVLNKELITADAFLARRLQVQLGSEVVFLNRLRLIDGEPAAIERAYIPNSLFPAMLDHDFSRESLYEVFSDEYDMKPDHAEQEIRAELATERVANLLGLTLPAVVLIIHRETHAADGQVIEYVESEFRGDRFRFYTHLEASTEKEFKTFQRFPVNNGRGSTI